MAQIELANYTKKQTSASLSNNKKKMVYTNTDYFIDYDWSSHGAANGRSIYVRAKTNATVPGG